MKKIVYAKNKYVNTSARKTRLLADLIRGKDIETAINLLKFSNKGVATEVLKTLNSAIANAVFNNDMDKKNLEVIEVFVDEAPTFKRGKAVSRGRYHKILKRNCHINIGVAEVVNENDDDTKKENKKTDTKKKV